MMPERDADFRGQRDAAVPELSGVYTVMLLQALQQHSTTEFTHLLRRTEESRIPPKLLLKGNGRCHMAARSLGFINFHLYLPTRTAISPKSSTQKRGVRLSVGPTKTKLFHIHDDEGGWLGYDEG